MRLLVCGRPGATEVQPDPTKAVIAGYRFVLMPEESTHDLLSRIDLLLATSRALLDERFQLVRTRAELLKRYEVELHADAAFRPRLAEGEEALPSNVRKLGR